MTCISEEKLKLLASGKVAASHVESEHLLQCDRCREIFLIFKHLNDQLTSLFLDEAIHIAVPKSAGQNQTIILKPIPKSNFAKEGQYRLAAWGAKASEPYLLFAFSNEKEGLLGRVLQERDTGIVKFYLIGESVEKVQGLYVTLEGCGLEGVTDLNGIIDFGQQERLQIENVRVRTPLTTVQLAQIKKPTDESEKHIFTIKHPYHDEVIIEIDRQQPRSCYRLRIGRKLTAAQEATLQVVAITDRRTLVGFPEHGVTVLETDEKEKILKIHIY